MERDPELPVGEDPDVALPHLYRSGHHVAGQLLPGRRDDRGTVQRSLDLDDCATDFDIDPALASDLSLELNVEVILSKAQSSGSSNSIRTSD